MAMNNGNDMMDESMQEGQQGLDAVDQALHAPENIKKSIDDFNNLKDRAQQAFGNKGNAGGQAAKQGAQNAAQQGSQQAAQQGAKQVAQQAAQQAAQEGAKQVATAAATQAATQGAATAGGAAAGGAAGSAGGPIGMAIGAAVGLIAGQLKKLASNDGSGAAKWAILGAVCFGLPLYSFVSWGNPRSVTNTVEGMNAEALQADMTKDNNFLASQGITADQINDEVALEYMVDDQYNQMAGIIKDAVNSGYQKTLAKYPAEKAAARNSITDNHDDQSSVYLYDGKYYDTVSGLGVKNGNLTTGDEQELEGDEWDDADYLNDNSNNGAMDSGMAYILAAYTVSKCNTAPISYGDDYTYYDSLKKLVEKEETQLGFFAYSGATVSTELTQKVEVKKVEQVTKYEKATTNNGSKYCSYCTNQKNYTQQGVNNSSARGTKHTVSKYICDSCDAVFSGFNNNYYGYCYYCGSDNIGGYSTKYCKDCGSYDVDAYGWCCYKGSISKTTVTYYTCSAGHVFGSTNTSAKANYPSGNSAANYTYADDYKVYEVTNTTNEDFDYTQYRYTASISPFSYQDLLERMFLDDNDFYTDVQGTNYVGSFGGAAATITAGDTVTLPSGLGGYFTYMGWQMITSTTSKQYQLMQATGMPFDSEGFGKINGRYVIACTTTFGQVGDYIDFYQSDGTVLQCIIGDIKNQADAGCTQWGHNNGQVVVEFVVDKTKWYPSHANPGTATCHPEWGGKTIVKAVNGGNYFDNPNFVKSLAGEDPDSNTGVLDVNGVDTGATSDCSDMQLKVANLAVMSVTKNMGVYEPKAGYCAQWVTGLYMAAGAGSHGGNAIDFWTKWSSSGSSDMSRIPVGAAVVGSGSSSQAGRLYGHIGIYVGDTNGDGVGEVVDNIGRVTISSINQWISWQTTPVCPSYGGSYGPGFVGWVWPGGVPLGTGYEYTGVDASLLVTSGGVGGGGAASLDRAQRLANIMASPYYEWGVYYEYTCDHETTTATKCPQCGADIKTKTKGILWWKTILPCFEYVKAEEPDNKIKFVATSEGMKEEKTPYTVSQKIDWYVDFMLESIDAAAQYETGSAASNYFGGSSGLYYSGAGNQTIVEFALSKVGTGGAESWAYYNMTDNWCAMFVSYCANACGFIDSGIIPKYCGCDAGMNWFKQKGLWQSRESGYEPKPGDIIFYGTNADSNHTGIVEKSEGGMVYTIEGNSGSSSTTPYYKGSKVTRHTYSLSKSNIVGYGTPEYPTSTTLTGGSAGEQIFNFLSAQGLTRAGVAGLMGNLNAESGLVPTRLQGDFSSGYTTSAAYTQKVDSGAISRHDFTRNGPNGGGYGLAQWTYYTRKEKLYDYAKQKGASIGDLGMQLEFLMIELQNSFPGVLSVLRTSNDLTTCTRKVLYDFENPAVKNLSARLNLAQQYY